MNRICFALFATALMACAAPAAAADFPAAPAVPYLRAPSAIVAANWGGFYVGGSAGYAWARRSYLINNGFFSEGFNITDSAFIGGGQAGVQAQWGHWVFGLEGTYSWTGIDQTSISLVAPPNSSNFQINQIGTLDGKLGWALDRLLIYGKAGLAYGHVRNTYQNFAAPVVFDNQAWQAGYNVAAGVDYMWLPNWTVGLEFDYYNMSLNRTIATGAIDGHADVYALMARLNYLCPTWW